MCQRGRDGPELLVRRPQLPECVDSGLQHQGDAVLLPDQKEEVRHSGVGDMTGVSIDSYFNINT